MPDSHPKTNQDDILELTDVIENGDSKEKRDNKFDEDHEIEDEISTLFSESKDKRPNLSSQDNQEDLDDDLDLDSFFQEIENKGKGKRASESEKETNQYENIQAEISKLHQVTEQNQENILDLSSRITSIEQSLTNLSQKISNLEEQKSKEDQSTNEKRLFESLQQNMYQELDHFIHEKVEKSLTKYNLSEMEDKLQETKKDLVDQNQIESMRKELKEELSEYIRKIIPSIAAQVIREEIRAITEEDQNKNNNQ